MCLNKSDNILGLNPSIFWGACVLIASFNIVTVGSALSAILTIPQYILVFYLILSGKLEKAILWHFTFVMLGLSSQGAMGMFEGEQIQLYNYTVIKLVGPIRACYAINILLVILLLSKRNSIDRSTLFYRLYKVFLLICGMATIIGLIGLLFNPYYTWKGFIGHLIYMFVVLSSMYILLCFSKTLLCKSAYNIGIYVLLAACTASVFCYLFLGVKATYGGLDMVYTTDVVFFSPILILGLLYFKYNIPVIIGVVSAIVINIASLSGKGVFAVAFCVLVAIYLMFFNKKYKEEHSKRIHLVRPLITFLIIVVVAVISATNTLSLTIYKANSALSMFNGDLEQIDSSPYIRVASLINILHEGMNNIFVLLFGNGYGGYFEDQLNLFAGLDLERGAWNEDDVKLGRFHSGHDSMVTLPLFNGIIGTVLVINICIRYIKRININYFNAIAFLWVLLLFYANTVFAYAGTFLLFAAEYDIRNDRKIDPLLQ